MNFQQYANYYGSFHGVAETDIIKNCIVYKLEKISWAKTIVLKLKNFVKSYDDSENKRDAIKPLSRGLMKHFKLESPCTVFLTDDSFSVLYGSTYLVYPHFGGSILVVATQYFVQNSKVFQQHMTRSNAECVSENIYYYKSAVVYLDEFDIPYPGGRYYSEANTQNALGRICFVLDEQDSFRIQELVQDFENVSQIHYKALQSKCINASISKFVDATPVSEIHIPTLHYEYTNIVVKRLCYQNPNFILQDILNSCFITQDVGIVIEYPICLSYVSLHQTHHPRKFYCFAINCHHPNKFIHVPSPYDRYYQYNYGIQDIQWIPVYYDPITQKSEAQVMDVVIDTNIVGHVYKETFFCLGHPKLSNTLHYANINTKYVLNTLTFDIEKDPTFHVVYMQNFKSDFILYCVKHKHLPYDLYCLQKPSQHILHYKTTPLPYLVENWASMIVDHQPGADLHFGDLNFIKLMYSLARHKICFNLRESKKRDILYENERDIIFEVEKNAIDFINNMKLEFISKNRPKLEEESKCILS